MLQYYTTKVTHILSLSHSIVLSILFPVILDVFLWLFPFFLNFVLSFRTNGIFQSTGQIQAERLGHGIHLLSKASKAILGPIKTSIW
jgi:hypothetical protein